jgi:hypothetical protein
MKSVVREYIELALRVMHGMNLPKPRYFVHQPMLKPREKITQENSQHKTPKFWPLIHKIHSHKVQLIFTVGLDDIDVCGTSQAL